MSNKKAAIIKGDGTGPELVNSMISVLKACNSDIDLITCDAGSEWWEKNGGNSYISNDVWSLLETSDACFKGPTTTVPDPDKLLFTISVPFTVRSVPAPSTTDNVKEDLSDISSWKKMGKDMQQK